MRHVVARVVIREKSFGERSWVRRRVVPGCWDGRAVGLVGVGVLGHQVAGLLLLDGGVALRPLARPHAGVCGRVLGPRTFVLRVHLVGKVPGLV